MECKDYKFNKAHKGAIVNSSCSITNHINRTGCSLSSDEDVEKMDICFNCKYWLGGGDWGLSCQVDYYNCSTNGFDRACDSFVRRNL